MHYSDIRGHFNSNHLSGVTVKINCKEKEFKRIESRLYEWGVWIVKCIKSQAEGYPSQSTLISAMQGSRSTAPKYPYDNRYAEEVNAIVLDMEKAHPDWGDVLRREYTDVGSQSSKAKNAGLTRFDYRINLGKAKAWVEARLR